MGFFSSIFGRKSNQNSGSLIEITSNQEEEDGWQDLIFSITEKKNESNIWNLKCEGVHGGVVVGFRIYINEGIDAGINEDGIDSTKFIVDGIRIESIGEKSDKLIEIMSSIYKQPIVKKFTQTKLNYTIFPLNNEKAILENGRFKFKLFFDDNDEQGLYSELYINPNLPNGTLELNEKDEDYRENIIKSMTSRN